MAIAKKFRDVLGDGGSDIIGQLAAQNERLKSSMAHVRHKVAIMSGKGGVGKSTITVNLAGALALQGYQVGVLDADINGPTIPRMMGVQRQPLLKDQLSVFPVLGPMNIRVMSMDLLLPEDKAPVVWKAPGQQNSFVWRGTLEANTLREFLADTAWGKLDFLLLDLPPGSQALPTLAQLIPGLTGLVVTIPSGVSLLVVKKFIVLAQEMHIPMLGLVENMAGHVCPHCGRPNDLFYAIDSEEKVASELGIPHLGRIPFDPRLSVSTDWGIPFIGEYGHSPAGEALARLGGKVKQFFAEEE